MPTPSPLNVIIIGGSCAGLMAGILLQRAGHNVRILERAATNERESLAAGIGFQFEVKRFFETRDRLKHIPFQVPGSGLVILNRALQEIYKIPLNIRLTSWDATYYRLRANFDGFTSRHCPELPPTNGNGTEGEGVYSTGIEVVEVKDFDGHMLVVAKNTSTSETEQFQGDLIIAADGANSAVRRQMNPHLQRDQPGYMIWRGTVQESELSQSTQNLLVEKLIIHPTKYNYCVIYTIPGEYGSLVPGQRHLNFAWYFWPSSPAISEIMTDVDGHVHRTTMPKGKLREEIWQAQLKQARDLFPDAIVELAQKIRQPFVSTVSSIASPRAAYFDNRLFLIGDALSQIQPNAGLGTNLAARGALLLSEAIGPASAGSVDQTKIAAWEKQILNDTHLTNLQAKAWASWYLCGWPTIGWDYGRYWATRLWKRHIEGWKSYAQG